MRNRLTLFTVSSLVLIAAGAFAGTPPECLRLEATLYPRSETPAISDIATGSFEAELLQLSTGEEPTLSWSLHYPGVAGVTQAHIHLGQEGVGGGIMMFLCTNLGNGPAGTVPCPEDGITEDTTAHHITGPIAQGVQPEDFFAFQRAVRQGVAYVNVHTTKYPGGLMRGQLKVVGPCEGP